MKTLITEVKEMRGELRSVKVTMDDLESSHTYLSGQMEDLLQDIKTLKSDQASLRKHVSSFEGKHDTVSSKVDQLELILPLKKDISNELKQLIRLRNVWRRQFIRRRYSLIGAVVTHLDNVTSTKSAEHLPLWRTRFSKNGSLLGKTESGIRASSSCQEKGWSSCPKSSTLALPWHHSSAFFCTVPTSQELSVFKGNAPLAGAIFFPSKLFGRGGGPWEKSRTSENKVNRYLSL
ncbi:conserved hypothetical protein [Culex quinquefasciatus]|uniref:Uncharacterized protein n=1 Tax=Culex quinquefasciatus TaxID=7176 RepID=B0XK61_CULQU|nr:conserved hypothetical protein [Culex quinquefasciatus]|eukprot:XP_001870033.1 conserved hypothetical protein [Culex quinquefasciatus]